MRLVNGFKLMEFAKRYHYVLPAFNTTNLENDVCYCGWANESRASRRYSEISSDLNIVSWKLLPCSRCGQKVRDTYWFSHLDHGNLLRM